MSQGPVFFMFVLRMESRDAREGSGSPGCLGKIFVAFQTDGNADFRFSVGRIGGGGRPEYPENMAPAAYGHTLAESDLGGHAQGEFDF